MIGVSPQTIGRDVPNGTTTPDHSGHPATNDAGDVPNGTPPLSGAAAAKKNSGPAAPVRITAGRLDQGQRIALRDHVAGWDEKAIRKRFHLSADAFDRAISGGIVPVEVLSRIAAVLALKLNGAGPA